MVEEPTQRPVERLRRRRLLLIFPAILALMAAGMLIIRPTQPRITSFTALTSDGHTKVFDSRLLTDGARLYLQESREGRSVIAQTAVGGGETSILAIPFQGAEIDDVAKDGSALLVQATEETASEDPLWRVPLPSGSPMRLGTLKAHSAAWSPSMDQLIFSQGHALFAAGSDGTNPRELVALDGTADHLRFSPRGDQLSFTLRKDGSSSLWRVNPDGRGLKPVFSQPQTGSQDCCGTWTPDGRYFVFQRMLAGRSDIWALRDRSHWLGDPVATQLTNGPLDFSRPLPSKDGTKIFVIGAHARAELVRYDPKTGFAPYMGGISAEGVTFSSNGEWVAYVSVPDGTLWRSKVDGSERIQLTRSPLRAALPRWSPDGKRIVFVGRSANSDWRAYLISATGSEMQELLLDGRTAGEPVWSADGKSIYVSPLESFRGGISKLDVATKVISDVRGSANLFSQRCSPDGKYIAALTTDSRRLMLYSLASGEWTELVSVKDMLIGYPNWSHDGEYVYFDRVLMNDPALYRVRISDRTLERLVSLANVRQFSGDFWQWSGLAPDDSPLLVRDASTQEVYALDWQAP